MFSIVHNKVDSLPLGAPYNQIVTVVILFSFLVLIPIKENRDGHFIVVPRSEVMDGWVPLIDAEISEKGHFRMKTNL